VGRHPEDGEPIVAGIGRYGAYVQHGKTYANLEPGDDVLTVGLNRAVTLIADKRTKGPRGRRFAADPGRSLGDHPDKGGPIVVKSGRYGPYVSHDGLNATIPREKSPEAITLDEAVGLLAARAERVGDSPKRTARGTKKAAKTSAGEADAEAGDAGSAAAGVSAKSGKKAAGARTKAKDTKAKKPAARKKAAADEAEATSAADSADTPQPPADANEPPPWEPDSDGPPDPSFDVD
jgi:DNA topoisomerase-1